MTEIVGIFLLRNEDVFVEQSVRNVVGFCDRIIVSDNYSSDNTWTILQSLSQEIPKIELYRIRHPRESHELIANLAGKNIWLFGVDGDEIYDPEGLKRFRSSLLSGAYDNWWTIFGNVLNVTEIDTSLENASGYLAPPSRSITKLYNFGILKSWGGNCPERLHGGTPVFRAGHDIGQRYEMHRDTSWDQANFRCLHTCFVRRSSKDTSTNGRFNPAELNKQSWTVRMSNRLLETVRRHRVSDWKRNKYMRGEKVTLNVKAFFPEA